MNITELEIEEFLKNYVDAANSRDFANIADMIHLHALFRFGEGDFVGPDEIRGVFENAWDGTSVDTSYGLSDIRAVISDSKLAVVAYSFKWSGVEDGRSFLITGRGTSVIVRIGQKLQCIYEHLSR